MFKILLFSFFVSGSAVGAVAVLGQYYMHSFLSYDNFSYCYRTKRFKILSVLQPINTLEKFVI